MFSADDRIHISQTALNKAGRLGWPEALRHGEKLAPLLKFAVERSGLASGRSRHRFGPSNGTTRRRYGDFLLILRGPVLIDIVALQRRSCRTCLGTKLVGQALDQPCPDCQN
jgi:hypothetical protein